MAPVKPAASRAFRTVGVTSPPVQDWQMCAMVAAGLAIICLLPQVFRAVPSALIAIVVLTVVAILTRADVKTVGDMGTLPTALPPFGMPKVPLILEALGIIFPGWSR